MGKLKKQELQQTLDEVFWGDYRIDPQTVKQKIADNDEYFLRFLVSRIVTHSLSPSSSPIISNTQIPAPSLNPSLGF